MLAVTVTSAGVILLLPVTSTLPPLKPFCGPATSCSRLE